MNLGKMAVMTPIVMNIVQGIFGKNINEIAPNLYKKIINKCKILTNSPGESKIKA